MRICGLLGLFVLLAAAPGQAADPVFVADSVRPHGAAEPHPLAPGIGVWIFGANLGAFGGCTAQNIMDPSTYRTELCGTSVRVGGISARLIYVSDRQINLVLPDHPWKDELVEFQVIRDGHASRAVPVYFGFNRPVVSLAEPAYAGMPVWVKVRKPWGTGRLRYPVWVEPWALGSGWFEVRFEGKPAALWPVPDMTMLIGLNTGEVGLPRPVPEEYLHRAPLHLWYRLDRPGTYEVRYIEYRYSHERGEKTIRTQSDWTAIEILPSTAEQRRVWLREMAGRHGLDTVELMANHLPALLASHDEAALWILSAYLGHREQAVRHYARYALNYFDAEMLERVVPGRQPMRGGIR